MAGEVAPCFYIGTNYSNLLVTAHTAHWSSSLFHAGTKYSVFTKFSFDIVIPWPTGQISQRSNQGEVSPAARCSKHLFRQYLPLWLNLNRNVQLSIMDLRMKLHTEGVALQWAMNRSKPPLSNPAVHKKTLVLHPHTVQNVLMLPLSLPSQRTSQAKYIQQQFQTPSLVSFRKLLQN